MPAIPTPSVKLDDGMYEVLLDSVKTITKDGPYGKQTQEECLLYVLDPATMEKYTDDAGQPVKTRFWITHGSIKHFNAAKDGGILLVDEAAGTWSVNAPIYARIMVVDGKVRSIKANKSVQAPKPKTPRPAPVAPAASAEDDSFGGE